MSNLQSQISNDSNIVVSICCLSFNHAPFIRKALDGFLMQEPPSCMPKDAKLGDWCEILIHDDCSTDGTDAIIREYAAKYPDVIFPLYEEINQYTHGGKGHMDFFNYNRARGKYLACCEADDCWIDSQKLKKQVDFMELHPDYSACWHRVEVVDTEDMYMRPGHADDLFVNQLDASGIDLDIPTFFKNWYTQPCSMVIRKSLLDYSWHTMYKTYCDTYEIYHLLKSGKGHILNFVGAKYRLHQGGVAGSMDDICSCLSELGYMDELYKINRDQYTKDYWKSVLLWTINTLDEHGDYKKKCSIIWRELNLFPIQTLKILFIITKRIIKIHVKKTIK